MAKWLSRARIAGSLLALSWVIATIVRDPRALDVLSRALHPVGLVACVVLPCLATMLGALRWRVLLAEEGLRLPFSWLLRETFVGRFVGAFTPSTVGLDGYRTVSVAKRTGEALKASRALVVEKALGLLGLAAITAACALLNVRGVSGKAAWLAVLACLALASFAIVLVRAPHRISNLVPTKPRVLERVRLRISQLTGSNARPLPVVFALTLGLLSHAITASCFVAGAFALSLPVSLTAAFAIGNAVVLMTLLPISIGGIGVREGTAVMLFGLLGVSASDALAVSLLAYVCGQAPAVLGGVIMLISKNENLAKVASEAAPIGSLPKREAIV